MDRTIAPYGSWRSPITAEKAASASVGRFRTYLDGETVYWMEMRPQEQGRNVIVRRDPDGSVHDVTPPGFSARTRVHEYGGGHYIAVDGVVYFSNLADQRIYRQAGDAAPEPITPEGSGMRYADYHLDRQRNRLVCVREDHSGGGEAVNTLVSIDLPDGGPGGVLAQGYDFYSDPRLNPAGDKMCWLCWRHPNMPWDGTELWIADVTPDGSLANERLIAGGARESIYQPSWSPDGTLHFVSDRTGWWNLYRYKDDHARGLWPMKAEFGQPQWSFDVPTYGFLDAETLLCSYEQAGQWHVARLDATAGTLTDLYVPYPEVRELRTNGRLAVGMMGGPDCPFSIVRINLRERPTVTLLASADLGIDLEYLSMPQMMAFPTTGALEAHGFFYPPRNPLFAAPQGERPPLLVLSHGGPTASSPAILDPEIQFWTSRGFAVFDVDYRGSTGYGRAYRERLNGEWGVVDLDDCVNGALYLAKSGHVDGDRLAIRGGSAGGYTTLCALTFTDVFKAGASYYGVSDLVGLATDTHKFESRYLDSMVGPYPERKDIYDARSPINFTDRLSAPLILFQGLDDPVVPPPQSEKIYEALKAKGVPVAYVTFEGEQHGFRQAKNQIRAMEAELYFYGRVFGFNPADEIEPVAIENLPAPEQ